MHACRPILLAVVFHGLALAQLAPERFPIPPVPPIGPPRPPIVLPPPRVELPDPATEPMQIRELTVVAAVRGLYATVATTLVFHNPNARQLEGELVFPLPDGAAVCGYALDINGVLVDGVVVRKEQARVAFETETRRQIDPGLVEHVQGNLYRTRIYPLPPKGVRTIRLTYTTPLAGHADGDAALLLPMPRAALGKRSVTIEVAADGVPAPELGGLGDRRFERAEHLWRVSATESAVTPGEDVWVALPKLPDTLVAVEKDAAGVVWFYASTRTSPAPAADRPPPPRVHVLWDASGSREGPELALELALLEALPATTACRLTVFRDVPEAPRDFPTPAALVAALKATPYDGGTDFAALAAALLAAEGGVPLLLFSDGLDTLSDRPIAFGDARPIAIVANTVADREALRQAGAGALVDLQILDTAAALRQVLQPPPRVIGVRGSGIAEVQGLGRPASGRVTILGRLVAPAAELRLEFSDGRVSAPCHVRAADAREGSVLATAWAAARVAQLTPRAELFTDELLALGRRHGLVSPATSLLVLESLDQWVRHAIEPPAMLPEMRDQWRAAMKRRGQQTTDSRAQHLAEVTRQWEARVAWWQTDFAKTPPPPKPQRGDDAVLELPPAAPMPAAQALGERRSRLGGDVAAATPFPAVLRRIAGAADAPAAARPAPEDKAGAPAAAIRIKGWDPDTPYLKALKAAAGAQVYAEYLKARKDWSRSPAFFLDCAEFFLARQETALGLRILSNLAELRLEDAALLRVYAWRLRQAGEFDRAVVLLRRVVKLRGEEPQSFRDLALVLAERGQAKRAQDDLEEAMRLLWHVVETPWQRHGATLAVFALEELNALTAWIGRQDWPKDGRPAIPEYDAKLRANLDTDLRIVMAWDADATDIDLHVEEPGGETAFYGRNRTTQGGLISQDITDGYGPEEYLIRRAPSGAYTIKANYYGSRQQTLVGPATVTATVFTNWGRPGERRQTLALRLDKPRDLATLGTVQFGAAGADGRPRPVADFRALRPGMTWAEVAAACGEPAGREGAVWRYAVGAGTVTVQFDAGGGLLRIVETLPGGIETVLVQ